MIIRSGLIQNLDDVDVAAFGRHWREVHGPLAARLPKLKGYVQNHIVERIGSADGRLHRVDGISQLWFEDVEAMKQGMASPENDACIADISGFLARVTLAVQDPGRWDGAASLSSGAKLMAVYLSGTPVDRLAIDLAEAFRPDRLAVRWRLNPVVAESFIVDPSIARSEERVLAILEVFLEDDAARRQFTNRGALASSALPRPAAILAVQPYVFIAPPA